MNGWDRVPDTLTARCRVQDYLRRPVPRAPWVRVLRVARMIELLRAAGQTFPMDIRISRDLDDVWNDAVRVVNAREREAAEAAARTPSWERITHELTEDGELRPVA